ncbi:hypothetical protein BDN72DRAFT_340340 [Pluteus cervinus]|uniref:Uncharacterized protein n=1 Tax=Pluteus cervinus TaxID=181527 RepID=A0ACD3ABW8_9AGAR|nr:hypothetical protein BDN72DRAFT_340340 [Pluteus cervinus]
MSSQSTSSTPSLNVPLNIQRTTSLATNIFPWNNLPTELQTTILCLASTRLPTHIAPIHFGLVSHCWRALTWTIHSWWTKVDLDFDPPFVGDPITTDDVHKIGSAYLWLSRAGNRPTTINITHRDPRKKDATRGHYFDLYAKLFKHEVPLNIGNLVLNVHPHILGTVLGFLSGGCKGLKQLDVMNIWDHRFLERNQAPAVPFNPTCGTVLYPSLNELTIVDFSPGSMLIHHLATSGLSSCANLTHLTISTSDQHPNLKYFDTIYPILRHAPKLSTLGLTIPCWTTNFEFTTPPVPIDLQDLKQLTIHISRSSTTGSGRPLTNPRPILQSLSLPSLQSLALINLHEEQRSPCVVRAIADLGYRSNFSLTRLSIQGFKLDDLRLIGLLRSLLTLERLDLADCRLDCINLLRALKYESSSTSTATATAAADVTTTPCFLPRLRTFQLLDTLDGQAHHLGFLSTSTNTSMVRFLLELVMSRWVIPVGDPVVQWQEVTILIWPLSDLGVWDEGEREMLRWFGDQQGIEVELVEFGRGEGEGMDVDVDE